MFVILSFLWAAAIVIHQTHFCRIDELPYVVLNVAAVLTLLRPSSLPRFAFLHAAQLNHDPARTRRARRHAAHIEYQYHYVH